MGLSPPIFAYAFFGLDALNEELEEPFALSANDLALSVMARSVEISILERLRETEFHSLIQPTNYRLE
ncbi:bestrophin family ion channel [uncultured Paraglaciecola sp.]|uniref:bestrophin family ion channel n=1 Tax=uncultured Paraglaciecola sp. TaxID=1765024 RepID=UPI0030DC28A4|tara:strand:+ start:38067 stop:38270 length:204 start_codon:yes stop_codon:yes gene_type:complete